MNYKWGIYVADLNPTKGSEQKGSRPVIIISDEEFNRLMPVVTVLPITSLKEGRKVYPNEAFLKKAVGDLNVDSLVLAHQIRTIAKTRLRKYIGFIADEAVRESVNGALRVHLNL